MHDTTGSISAASTPSRAAARAASIRRRAGSRCSAPRTTRSLPSRTAVPHKQGPLSEGIVHGASVTCPLHNWVFDLATGKALGADEGQVKTYPIDIVERRIFMAAERLMVAAE